MWRQPETKKKDKLTWVCESPGMWVPRSYEHSRYLYYVGDFHFLWECLRVVFGIFWGTPAQPGSLCNLREIVRRTRVDKAVKVFNVGDEFLIHVFKSHLIASIMRELKMTDCINHTQSHQWLHDTAKRIVSCALMPTQSDDPVYQLHTSFLHLSFLYVDLREAIRWEKWPSNN